MPIEVGWGKSAISVSSNRLHDSSYRTDTMVSRNEAGREVSGGTKYFRNDIKTYIQFCRVEV